MESHGFIRMYQHVVTCDCGKPKYRALFLMANIKGITGASKSEDLIIKHS